MQLVSVGAQAPVAAVSCEIQALWNSFAFGEEPKLCLAKFPHMKGNFSLVAFASLGTAHAHVIEMFWA